LDVVPAGTFACWSTERNVMPLAPSLASTSIAASSSAALLPGLRRTLKPLHL
jgi:hypothetical protein